MDSWFENVFLSDFLFIWKLLGTFADSRPRLVTGSPEGYPGHVDGRLRDARLNHPKGITVDDRGNIYVADTVNNAIRKISEGGNSLRLDYKCICGMV